MFADMIETACKWEYFNYSDIRFVSFMDQKWDTGIQKDRVLFLNYFLAIQQEFYKTDKFSIRNKHISVS